MNKQFTKEVFPLVTGHTEKHFIIRQVNLHRNHYILPAYTEWLTVKLHGQYQVLVSMWSECKWVPVLFRSIH